MFKLMAGALAGVAAFFHGFIGGHPPMASSTPPHWGDSATSTPWQDGDHAMHLPAVFGKVSAVDGSLLTVIGRSASSTASTTFSVDASSAKIFKGPATSTASITDISVGDFVGVEGTISGTSVTATVIHDGLPPRMMDDRKMMGAPGKMGTSTGDRPWRMGTSTPRGPGKMMPGGMHPLPARMPAPQS